MLGTVRVWVRVRVSISIYLIAVVKLRIGSVLTNDIRRSANPQSAFYPWPLNVPLNSTGKVSSGILRSLDGPLCTLYDCPAVFGLESCDFQQRPAVFCGGLRCPVVVCCFQADRFVGVL